MVVRIIVNLDGILIMNSTLQGSLRFQVSGKIVGIGGESNS